MLYWDLLLKPTRFRSSSSVAPSPNDMRSPFKKDFDTVCNSTIIRRLQDKAQVFPLEEEDYARTRLTHSIEVMSIAESLGMQARKVVLDNLTCNLSKNDYSEEESARIKRNVEDIPMILATAALLHDMGNPPFGHLGEQIIGDWFRNNLPKLIKSSDGLYAYNDVGDARNTLAYKLKGSWAEDLIHFEGNAQLLRLVTKLNYVVDENGMNLTFPVMATFIKYPCSSIKINKDKLSAKKTGYFTAEKDQFDLITRTLGLKGSRHPLAFLLEAADDIAYLTADLEDAQKKGIVSLDCLEMYLKQNENDPIIKKTLLEIQRYRDYAKQSNYPNVDDYVIRRIRIFVKGIMIDAMNEAFSAAYRDIMSGVCETELISISSVAILAETFRKIERDKIYYCESIVKNKTRAFRIIQKLLEAYVPAVLNYKATDSGKDTAENILYLSLSENYRYICEQANKNTDNETTQLYNRLLLVTDQISGMTDSRAMSIYRMLSAI